MHNESSHSRFNRRSFLKTGAFSALAGAILGKSTAEAQVSQPLDKAGKPVSANKKAFFKAATKRTSGIANIYETIKKEGTPEDLYRFLYAMPKGGDLHHHMGGSMLPDMWYRIATDKSRNGGQTFYTRFKVTNYTLPESLQQWSGPNTIRWMTVHEQLYNELSSDLQGDFKPLESLSETEKKSWKSSVVLDSISEGRDEFFEYHWPRLGSLLSDATVIGNLMVENMEMYGAEGIRYIEIMSGPWGKRRPDGTTMTPEEYDAFILNRLNQPDALATGVMIRFQTVVLRFAPDALDNVRKQYAFLDANRELWRGINMAGREDDAMGYPARFTEVYDEMLRIYPDIGISIHAGESEAPDSYIFDTLRLGASRIGHGCNLIQDFKTMQHMRAAQHLIEINLISNHLLKYVPDPKKHPFPIYLRQGIPVCFNTDDRGMWSSNMTDEYMLGVSLFNLSWTEMTRMAHNSIQFSFLNHLEKEALTASYEADMEVFEESFKNVSWQSRLAEVNAETYGYGKNYLKLKI